MGLLLTVSCTNATGAPPSSAGVARSAPSESSHRAIAGVAASGCDDDPLEADDDPAAGAFARSHAMASSPQTRRRATRRIMPLAATTARRGPNATHRAGFCRADLAEVCIAAGPD